MAPPRPRGGALPSVPMIGIDGEPIDGPTALAVVADEVRVCTRCALSARRTQAVPGEGNLRSDVLLVGEGPGAREDATGRPFVGPAGQLLDELLRSIGWERSDVFITNVVKCRPPENRDPEPDEVAACAPYLQRQLEVLDPALIVTLGRHSLGRFMPGERISQAHGTVRPVDPATGAAGAMAFALYHPAAALRSTEVERQSYADVARIPDALLEARARRGEGPQPAAEPATVQQAAAAAIATAAPPDVIPDVADVTLF
jgi:uracil-DNA glycosylase family 4